LAAVFVLLPTHLSYQQLVTDEKVAVEPLAPATTSAPAPLFFTGDVMLGRYVETLIARKEVRPFDFIRLFATSTAVIINFESAMSAPHIATPSGGMQFSTAPNSLELLGELRVTHTSLANNHARDYGLEGYQNAVQELTRRNFTSFGDAVRVSTTSITYIPHGEETIGLIGLHTLFVTPSRAELAELLDTLSASSSVQIAYVHWGNEYELTHSRAQADFAELLVELGVDVIIGHHPHVTQDIRLVGDVPVFYSLGNFIFDQYFSADVQEGLVLGLTIKADSYIFDLFPHYQCVRSTPCFMDDTKRAAYLGALADRSELALRSQIMAEKLVIPR
jgi:poly-gamma-glutamate synthesis protein (capsule biosynthesis protein)